MIQRRTKRKTGARISSSQECNLLMKPVRTNEQPGLHPRNKHRGRYDLRLLAKSCPELTPFIKLNDYGDESVDFFNPEAVKTLNKALLKTYYDISGWTIPSGYLCPPVPGRADYIHHIADLLAVNGTIPTGVSVTVLDIGTGANCIYPLIGHSEYQWSFIGSDIDPVAIASAQHIIDENPQLEGKIALRLQSHPTHIFKGIIQPGERISITICNPPFHASAADALSGTTRKLRNLSHKKNVRSVLNFGGQHNELWCEGGEAAFVRKMILQSREFAGACTWFSTLISKESNLKGVYKALNEVQASEVRTIPMGQGNKRSRIVAWSFERL